MLSARQRYIQDTNLFSPKKPKINYSKLPADFFDRSCSLKIRNSHELKSNKLNRELDTPKFGKRRPSPLILERKIVTALDKYENVEDEFMIRDLIFSSRNIRKLKEFSISM